MPSAAEAAKRNSASKVVKASSKGAVAMRSRSERPCAPIDNMAWTIADARTSSSAPAMVTPEPGELTPVICRWRSSRRIAAVVAAAGRAKIDALFESRNSIGNSRDCVPPEPAGEPHADHPDDEEPERHQLGKKEDQADMHMTGQEPRQAVGEGRTGGHQQACTHTPEMSGNARRTGNATSEQNSEVR